jgi:hypothetical protein
VAEVEAEVGAEAVVAAAGGNFYYRENRLFL